MKRLPTRDVAEEAGEGVWVEDGRLRCLPTDHYEFEMDWPMSEAKEEVRKIFMGRSGSSRSRPGVRRRKRGLTA